MCLNVGVCVSVCVSAVSEERYNVKTVLYSTVHSSYIEDSNFRIWIYPAVLFPCAKTLLCVTKNVPDILKSQLCHSSFLPLTESSLWIH